MSITNGKEKIKLYDKVIDLLFRARTLNMLGRQVEADKVLDQLQFTLEQMDVSEHLNNFERFQVERAMKLNMPTEKPECMLCGDEITVSKDFIGQPHVCYSCAMTEAGDQITSLEFN